jgi:hypothetical protein
LDVVAYAVDEEVGGRVVAAKGDLVAIALAGAGRRAGDEGEDRSAWSSICASETIVIACGTSLTSVSVRVPVRVVRAPYSGRSPVTTTVDWSASSMAADAARSAVSSVAASAARAGEASEKERASRETGRSNTKPLAHFASRGGAIAFENYSQ